MVHFNQYLLTFIIVLGSFCSKGQAAKEMLILSEEQFLSKKYKQALKRVNQSIELDSTNAEAYFLRSEIHEINKDFQNEFYDLTKCIQLEPGNFQFYDRRGFLLQRIGYVEDAIKDFSIALKFVPDSLRTIGLNNRATAYSQVMKFEAAYNDLIEAYQIDSNRISVLVNLGRVCDEVGKGEMTLYYLNRAVELDSSYYPIYGNIGFKYQEMGQYEKAISFHNKVLEINNNAARGYSNRSFCKLKLGNTKSAMKDINRSIQLYPANSYAYYIKGLIYIDTQEEDKACKEFNKATELGFTKQYGTLVSDLQMKHCVKY